MKITLKDLIREARRFTLPLVPWILGIAAWNILTSFRWIDPLLLASPSATLRELERGIASLELLRALGFTLLRAFCGFWIATLIGVPLGLMLGGMQIIQRTFGGVIDGLRSMPATALYPVFLLAFGAGDASKIAVVVFICTWALVIYTASGINSSGSTRRFLLKMHRVSKSQYFLDGLLLPALPSIIAGMRTVLSLALVITIGIEMIVGTKYGIGQAIFDAQNTYRIPQMYAAIVMAALSGVVMNWFFAAFASYLTPWHENESKEML